MNSTFFKKSSEIANAFIDSVLFIDDEIFPNNKKEDKTHNLEYVELLTAFSKAHKLCALNNPQYAADLNESIELAKKADIVVVDWRMDLERDQNLAVDEEADVEEDEPRGTHTLSLLKKILSDPQTGEGSLKLILIFTGEIDIRGIAIAVQSSLKEFDLKKVNDNTVATPNIRIIVGGKPTLKEKLKHVPEQKDWIIEYEDMPSFLVKEFSNMTEGLISSFALQALTTIRRNAFKILKVFRKELDPAYLSNKSLLPNPDDAENQLVELMRDSIGDLLNYTETQKTLDEEFVKSWVSEHLSKDEKQLLNRKGEPFKDEEGKALDLKYKVNEELINSLLFSGVSDIEKRFTKAFKKVEIYNKKLSKQQKNEFQAYIKVNNTSLFTLSEADHKRLDSEFAKLTHHKNLFKPNAIPPKLSLGVIIKGVNSSKYWICIQQKCDSVRLKQDEKRKFLFLPLELLAPESNEYFHFITPDGSKLRLKNKSFNIKTIKFEDNSGDGVVKAFLNEGKYLFKQLYSEGHPDHNPEVDEVFEWVFDLKDLHAQRVAHEFATLVSRVGLDESEWLRRSAGN